MAKLAYAGILLALTMPMAAAQSPSPPVRILANVPADNLTVTHWYKQNVYDPSDSKIGEIMDVLVDREGKIDVLIVGVGGFVGVGEKAARVIAGRHPVRVAAGWSFRSSASQPRYPRQIHRRRCWLL
jgi:hypothetical protein